MLFKRIAYNSNKTGNYSFKPVLEIYNYVDKHTFYVQKV